MAGLMGMNRYFADSGLKGMSQSASLQTQRENADTQMAAAHDATVKGTTASMGGSGAMLGYAAGPTVAGMMAPAAGTAAAGAAAAGGAAAGGAAAGAGAAGATTAAVAGTSAASAAGTGATVGSAAGPIGAVAGLAVGALAGWLFSEFG